MGKSYNYFTKLTVAWSDFGGGSVDGYGYDVLIPFTTSGVSFQLESGGPIEYSFNFEDVHGDMVSGNFSENLLFTNRVISRIWFRGTGVVRIEAW